MCALALPAAVHAQVDFTLPLGQVTAAPLPAAPLGSGAWRFEVQAGWAQLPKEVSLGPTHGGIVVDKAGNIYVSTDADKTGLLVFDAAGRYLRSIAPEFSGIHGLMIREENGKEFIYAAHVKGPQIVKLGLDGKAEMDHRDAEGERFLRSTGRSEGEALGVPSYCRRGGSRRADLRRRRLRRQRRAHVQRGSEILEDDRHEGRRR
jgi:hypothetical protein